MRPVRVVNDPGTAASSLGPGFAQGKAVPRKPVGQERDNFHNRPAAYRLRESAGRLLREWKAGSYIREMSWKYRVRARDIEDLLREAA
jgi:hypothetical protein